MKWIRGPVCGIDNCRSRLYKRDAGRKFCQFGHVAEGDLDIEDDDGEQYTQTRRLNIQFTETAFGSQATSRSTATLGILSEKGAQRLYGSEGRALHYKCLQHILRAITPKVIRHLYKDYGETAVNSLIMSIDPVLKLLWVRLVRKVYITSRPGLIELYVLIYLALRQLNRYPVFVDQYLDMLKKNKVPTINAMTLLLPEMKKALPTGISKLFAILVMPLNDAFYGLLAKWSTQLSLLSVCTTPLDYSYAIAFKLLADLRLPHAPQLLVIYHALAMEVTGGLFRQHAWYAISSVPEIQIVGLVQYVIRLYFLASPEIVDTSQWLAWLSKDEEIPCFNDKTQHMTTEEIMGLSKGKISNYLDWVFENLVPDRYKDPENNDLSVMEKKLDRIFTFQKSEQPPQTTVSNLPFPAVKNNLSTSQRGEVETQIEKFLCSRFSLSPSMLNSMREKIESNLYQKISYTS